MYPIISELHGDGIPVAVSCRVLDIARQPYYRWLHQPVGPVEARRKVLTEAVGQAHVDDPEFGYRFLADEVRLAGHDVCVIGPCGGSVQLTVGGPASPKRRKVVRPAELQL